MNDFSLRRMGMVMEPKPGEANEMEGVLNPAAVRGKDGALYLFPRLVGKGNYSRIGIARVLFDARGDPTGVERLGLALEPEADYERTEVGGGCEDPRISFVEPLQRYVMTYTALSTEGPRIALAVSDDLFHWRRLGLAKFHAYQGVNFDGVDDKDASIFPAAIPGPSGQPAMALLHRPLFRGTRPEEKAREDRPEIRDLDLESIWISYCHMRPALRGATFAALHRLASPVADWEKLKIGGGAPPILCRHGWLVMYHGVHETAAPSVHGRKMSYSAGVMVLAQDRPNHIVYRSPQPVLSPEGPLETSGIVDNVVFPTGVDRRDDLGMPDRFDVYYGMADNRIGVARLDIPETLPASAPAHAPNAESPAS